MSMALYEAVRAYIKTYDDENATLSEIRAAHDKFIATARTLLSELPYLAGRFGPGGVWYE